MIAAYRKFESSWQNRYAPGQGTTHCYEQDSGGGVGEWEMDGLRRENVVKFLATLDKNDVIAIVESEGSKGSPASTTVYYRQSPRTPAPDPAGLDGVLRHGDGTLVRLRVADGRAKGARGVLVKQTPQREISLIEIISNTRPFMSGDQIRVPTAHLEFDQAGDEIEFGTKPPQKGSAPCGKQPAKQS